MAEIEKKTENKPSIFTRAKTWMREMKSELKKVQWPTKKQTANNTVIVLICVAIVGVFIWTFDFLATNLIQALISLAG